MEKTFLKFKYGIIDAIFRLIQSFGATFWMIIIYLVKVRFALPKLSPLMTGVLLCIITYALSGIIILAARKLNKETSGECTTIEAADDTYLPVYLGYFFVALGVEDWFVLAFVYVIILLYAALMNVYFNPAFILFGYHYYHVINANGTRLTIICKSLGRNPKDARFDDLRRINNWTYISIGGCET